MKAQEYIELYNTPGLSKFMQQESRGKREIICIRKTYVDVAEDLIAGIMLNQIIFWTTPNSENEIKLTVKRDGHLWLAKRRTEWWEECRLTPKQVDTGLLKLEQKELIISATYKFNQANAKHFRVNWEVFLPALEEARANFSEAIGYKTRPATSGSGNNRRIEAGGEFPNSEISKPTSLLENSQLPYQGIHDLPNREKHHIYNENNNEDSNCYSSHRSGHSRDSAPLRVAVAPVPDANLVKSGASLVVEDSGHKDSPSLFHRNQPNSDGASRFVQETPPEVENSAAPHVKKTQSKSKQPKMSVEERKAKAEEKNALKKAQKEAERDRKNAKYYEYFGSKERYDLFYEYMVEALEAENTPSTEYGYKISMALNGLVNGHEFARPKLIGFQRWEKDRQAQPTPPTPAPAAEAVRSEEPVDPKVAREIWIQKARALYPQHVLDALDRAGLSVERYEFCLGQMVYQSDTMRLRTIENEAYRQQIEIERKARS